MGNRSFNQSSNQADTNFILDEILLLTRLSTETNLAIAFSSLGLKETHPIQNSITDKTPTIKLNILLFMTQINPIIYNYEFKTQKFHSIHQIHFSLLLLFHPLLLQLLQLL